MEIIKKEDNGIEFYTIDLTGQSGMSQSGLALLAGVSESALSQLEDTLLSRAPSEYLKPFIGKSLTLLSEGAVINGKTQGNLKIYKSSYCAAVLSHYASPPRSNPTAIVSSLKFMQIGIDSWIQNVTGWNQPSELSQLHTDVYIKRIENMRDHQIDDNLWMIFREAAELLLLIEKDWSVPINEFDILDGSIGRKWSDYRKGKPWAETVNSYDHQYRDQRGKRPCNAFQLSELPYFRRWLKQVYIPEHLPQYLVSKYKKQATRLIYTENGLLTDSILELTEVKRSTPQEEEAYQRFLDSREILRQGLLGGI